MSAVLLESTVYTRVQLTESPLRDRPQIALAGRSNVGKSSLINALAGRRQLAKVSATPGKTASINFYRVEPEGFYLVDLPGYGYARRGRAERQQWGDLIQEYLRAKPAPLALAVLLDCRLDPQEADLNLVTFAASLGLSLLPVLTKADQCSRQVRETRIRQWQNLISGIPPLPVSATGPASSRLGLEELWAALRSLHTRSGV